MRGIIGSTTGMSMGFLKWLLVFIAAVVVSMAVFLNYMKSHDGPIEIFSGGPFQTGELVTVEPNWDSIKDLETIQFQLLDPPRSRTTWLAVHKGKLYTISAFMNSPIGKIWKKWPNQAIKDGRSLLRIDGKIYERQLTRIPADSELAIPILKELDRKYHVGTNTEFLNNGNTWLFEIAPRNAT